MYEVNITVNIRPRLQEQTDALRLHFRSYDVNAEILEYACKAFIIITDIVVTCFSLSSGEFLSRFFEQKSARARFRLFRLRHLVGSK